MSKETGEIIKNRIEYWQNKYFKEKEKNKKIKDGILFVGRRNGKSAEQKIILDEYISKDKVREKIEIKTKELKVELEKKNKIIESIENLCIEKGDDENENYGGIVIWKFTVQIMNIIRGRNKVEEDK